MERRGAANTRATGLPGKGHWHSGVRRHLSLCLSLFLSLSLSLSLTLSSPEPFNEKVAERGFDPRTFGL